MYTWDDAEGEEHQVPVFHFSHYIGDAHTISSDLRWAVMDQSIPVFKFGASR
jgi:hypothetical protein